MSTSHRFHLIGIGGAGMSVVAELLKDRGLEVSGSDQKESPILDHLRDAGIEVFVGHDAAHVPADAVVVVSTAVRESNPELAEAVDVGKASFTVPRLWLWLQAVCVLWQLRARTGRQRLQRCSRWHFVMPVKIPRLQSVQ